MNRLLDRLAALAPMAIALPSDAQTAAASNAPVTGWPAQPIRVIATRPSGGSSGAVVRLIAPKLGQRLGRSVIVDNRPGAGGDIGLQAIAQAEPASHTTGVGAAGGPAAARCTTTSVPTTRCCASTGRSTSRPSPTPRWRARCR